MGRVLESHPVCGPDGEHGVSQCWPQTEPTRELILLFSSLLFPFGCPQPGHGHRQLGPVRAARRLSSQGPRTRQVAASQPTHSPEASKCPCTSFKFSVLGLRFPGSFKNCLDYRDTLWKELSFVSSKIGVICSHQRNDTRRRKQGLRTKSTAARDLPLHLGHSLQAQLIQLPPLPEVLEHLAESVHKQAGTRITTVDYRARLTCQESAGCT